MTTPAPEASRVRSETGNRRVRVILAGHVVADTLRPLLVWEGRPFPVYYIPRADVRAELTPAGETRHSRWLGDAVLHDVVTAGRTAPSAAAVYPNAPVAEMREAVRFDWGAMDEWLEEDEPVYTHARDPYSRVDILASSRHVRVELDGVTVAETRQPRILFETGLPPRYYMPLADLRLDLLRPSERRSHCPYKGEATYWSVDTGVALHRDAVWIYRSPLPESQKIAGLACFYNERVDLIVDGVRQERPHTQFS